MKQAVHGSVLNSRLVRRPAGGTVPYLNGCYRYFAPNGANVAHGKGWLEGKIDLSGACLS
jgi:hypothetical protein